MRPGAAALGVAILVAGIAAAVEQRPFVAALHGYGVDLAVGLAGAYLLYIAAAGIGGRGAQERFAALGALGGATLAASALYADVVAGSPVRVPAAPGQEFVAPHAAAIAVLFPDINIADRNTGGWPQAASLHDGARIVPLAPGATVRAGAFAFTAVTWPIAYVRARDASGRPVTTTQPNGAAFLSPFLTFPDVDSDGRQVDFLSIPPLHRDVGVKYYDGLPERNIEVPFLALQIREQNGATLYEGVAVTGRPVVHAGVELTFALGTYPSVIMTGVAPLWLFGAGLSLVLAGFAGYAVVSLLPAGARVQA
jgi:hypothetical protein